MKKVKLGRDITLNITVPKGMTMDDLCKEVEEQLKSKLQFIEDEEIKCKRLIDADLLIKYLLDVKENYHTGNMLLDACLVGMCSATMIVIEAMAVGNTPDDVRKLFSKLN